MTENLGSERDQTKIIERLRAELAQKDARTATLENEIAVRREKQWLFEGCRDD